MHKKPLVSRYVAIKRFLCSYITLKLSIYTKTIKRECPINQKFPLSKGRDKNRVFYITGLALQLAKYEKIPSMEIANAIASHLSANSAGVFSIQIVPPGWIHLKLAHPVLADWLQSLAESRWGAYPLQGGQRTKDKGETENNQCPMPDALFPVQYAHVRCCSLLRLGEQEGLITSDKAIPWLNNQQELCFHHPTELCLINELVKVVDELECSDSSALVKWEKVALALSQAFENFWRDCRIWGEIKANSPELAQARLGLVLATQSVLRRLLEEKLNIFALYEL
ncbi:MAG: glutamate acetyltransferase [Pelatocladus maniniholoensis HA4357-MV3]|uniref:arginine--tRNA ligase n=1 Tax=Pelatocladus maniniholoensis HA4357-MV3 TaxID=1117104 RepID=A0A9E3LSW6_9NOST|nr:glutamate acetyltransferase [Pelatocladus maniniholoensis HA4357-MV3]